MRTKVNISKRALQIAGAINDLQRGGTFPNKREIAAHIGVAQPALSKGVCANALTHLLKKELIQKNGIKFRMLQPMEDVEGHFAKRKYQRKIVKPGKVRVHGKPSVESKVTAKGIEIKVNDVIITIKF